MAETRRKIEQEVKLRAEREMNRKAEEEKKAKEEAERELARRAEAERRANAEVEAQKTREKAEVEKRVKEIEVSAASKLKFAKSLHSASLDAIGRESVRLEQEYINTLYEIIKQYPMTKAAKEAKELLDKR